VSGDSEPVANPVDDLLRSVRPRLDLAADDPHGTVARTRRAARRGVLITEQAWYQEQRDFEVLLREAIAHLARQAVDERAARESAEEQTRALTTRVEAALAGIGETLGEVERRLRHLENRLRADALERTRADVPARGGSAAGGSLVPPLDDFDYLAFEERFRGPEELVSERQRHHADRFAGVEGEVVDLGAGRGELLELLRERGVDAFGVDASAEMVALAQLKGLRAEHSDIFEFLAARAPGSLSGIICSHVLEHVWPADHVRFARLSAAALRPGGLLIVETPNPKSLIAGAINFSCDPTHLRPVFPETLAFMLESAGFEPPQIEYLSPVPAERRANPVTGAPPELAGVVAQINEAIQRLDDLAFGDMDYAVIARRSVD
jgi:O-antigen chain-terminating methyltransferase